MRTNNTIDNVLQLVNNKRQSNAGNDTMIACSIDKFSGTLFFDNFNDVNYISQQAQSRRDIFNISRNDGMITINFRRYSSYGYKITLSEFYRYIRFSFASKMLRMMETESKYIDFIEEFFASINYDISRDYIRKFLRPTLVEVHVDAFGAAAHRDWINARKLLIDNVLRDIPANTRKAKINKYYDGGYETLTVNKNNKPLLIQEMLETKSDTDGDRLCSSIKIYDKLYDIMISKYGMNRHWLKAYAQQLFGFDVNEIDYFIDIYSKLSAIERKEVYENISSTLGITRYEFTLTSGFIKRMCGYKKNPLNVNYSYNIQNIIDYKRDLMLYLIGNIWSISKKTRVSNNWKMIPIISKTINLLKNDEVIRLTPTTPNDDEVKMMNTIKANKNAKILKGRLKSLESEIDGLYTSGMDISNTLDELRQSSDIITAIFDKIIRYNQSYH